MNQLILSCVVFFSIQAAITPTVGKAIEDRLVSSQVVSTLGLIWFFIAVEFFQTRSRRWLLLCLPVNTLLFTSLGVVSLFVTSFVVSTCLKIALFFNTVLIFKVVENYVSTSISNWFFLATHLTGVFCSIFSVISIESIAFFSGVFLCIVAFIVEVFHPREAQTETECIECPFGEKRLLFALAFDVCSTVTISVYSIAIEPIFFRDSFHPIFSLLAHSSVVIGYSMPEEFFGKTSILAIAISRSITICAVDLVSFTLESFNEKTLVLLSNCLLNGMHGYLAKSILMNFKTHSIGFHVRVIIGLIILSNIVGVQIGTFLAYYFKL